MAENPYISPHAANDSPQREPGRCPTCGGQEFCEGTVKTHSLSSVFVPDNWSFFRFREGLAMKSLACVHCGQVRQFVAHKDLDSLGPS